MAGWTLLVWLAIFLLLTPFSSMILGVGIFEHQESALGNIELIDWLTSPAGLLYLLLAGALAMTGSVVRFAGIFEIVTGDLEGRAPGLRTTAMRVFWSLPRLFKACLVIVAALLGLLIPFVAGLFGIYLFFLGEYDINYYLMSRPAEWQQMWIVAAAWTSLWLPGSLYLAGRTLPALPAYLSGDYSLMQSVRKSWHLARDRTWRLLRLVAFALITWICIRLIVDVTLYYTASHLIAAVTAMTTSIRLSVILTGGFILLSVLFSLIIGFLIFSFGATLLIKFYYEDTDLHLSAPKAPGVRDLQIGFIRMIEPWLKPTRMIPLIILLTAGSLVASAYWLSLLPQPRDVVISAHRGGPPPSPENTLAALEASIEAGADYSEIDVQRAGDGTVVVIHDMDLMRVAGDGRVVADTPFIEMRDLVQRPDDGSPPSERRIATLEDFLERAGGRIKLMIELKYYGFDPDLARDVIAQVREYDMDEQVLLMSLDLRALRQIRELAPGIGTGYVSAVVVGEVSQLPFDFLAMTRQSISPSFLRLAREQNMEVYAWTVNDPEQMADLIVMGVGGLITDDPARAVSVRNELAEMTVAERVLLRFRRLITDDPIPGGIGSDEVP